MTKEEKKNYIDTLFNILWDGKRVWDKLIDIEENKHILPDKVLVCRREPAGWNELKFEMDWKGSGMNVVITANSRPMMGIWEWLFGDSKDRCFNKAVRMLDKASDEEQHLIHNVVFKVKDTPVKGMERNQKLVNKFLEYLDSLAPEVSQKEANLRADEIINND